MAPGSTTSQYLALQFVRNSALTVRCLGNTQEKAHKHQSRVVMRQCRARRHYGPSHHAHAHEDRGPDLLRRHEHVGWNLHEQVPDKQDADACIVLASHQF
jgi:hypothetical protein